MTGTNESLPRSSTCDFDLQFAADRYDIVYVFNAFAVVEFTKFRDMQQTVFARVSEI